MVTAIFGESCTGKSTLADMLKGRAGAQVYSGKDYLRLAKNESMAKAQFAKLLSDAAEGGENIIYVISEKEHLALLPDKAVRVLVTAPLELILERFAQRMHGTLPPPVKAMLEKKHGCFDNEPHDIHYESGKDDPADIVERIMQRMS